MSNGSSPTDESADGARVERMVASLQRISRLADLIAQQAEILDAHAERASTAIERAQELLELLAGSPRPTYSAPFDSPSCAERL